MKDQDAAAASISGESMSMSMSTDWTDEKHSLYLDSMEISFVHQLYTNNFTEKKKKEQSQSQSQSQSKAAAAFSSPSSKPFGRQFKVLRDGHWGRIDFERNNNNLERPPKEGEEVELDGAAALLLMNPWIRHFRSGSGRRSQLSVADSDDASISSATATARKGGGNTAEEASSASIPNNHINTEEMTDQNFIDEEDDEEKNMVKAKRIRRWPIAAAPRKDKSKN